LKNRNETSAIGADVSDLAAIPSGQQTNATVLGPLERVLSVFVAVDLFCMMVLRCIDVVGRYWLNMPVPGTSELTGLGLGVLIFAALPIVTAHSEHVSVSLLEMIAGRRSRSVEKIFSLTASLLALTVMALRLWSKAGVLASYSDSSSYLHMPLAPFAYFMSVMTALATMVVVLQIVSHFRAKRVPL
jgi:TRAP-type transport system small permease protein